MREQQNRENKTRWLSPRFLCSVPGLCLKNLSRKLEQDGQKGIHASAVWYLLSCEKNIFQMSNLSGSLCNFLPVSVYLSLSLLLPLVHWVALSAFCLSHFLLSCAFIPVGIHVHVPDLNPGGLGRCHGPDSGGCRSGVGSSSSHLLHPLPSVCYLGEELILLP